MNELRLRVLCFCVFLAGCQCGSGVMTQTDGGPMSSEGDASVRFDAGGSVDAGLDAGFDAGVIDAGVDAGVIDAGVDAGVIDAGVDAGAIDAGLTLELEAAVVDSVGDLYAVTLDGGSRLLVAWQAAGLNGFLRSPRWQPNGGRLAFCDGARPWLLEADGGLTSLNLTSSPAYRGSTRRVDWSPDGKRLAIDGTYDASDSDALFLVPADGGLTPSLVSDTVRWAWAADSSALLFANFVIARQTQVTWSYELATTDAGELATALVLDVSPSGVSVFQRRLTGADGGWEVALEARTATGSTFELLPRNTVSFPLERDGVTLNAAGTELALRGTGVVSGVPVGFKAMRVKLDGGITTLYDRPTYDPDFPACLRFLPDGERLSSMTAQGPSVLTLWLPDGGLTLVSTVRPLGVPAQFGCLDWHFRAN